MSDEATPKLLILGHLTRDVLASGEERLGGAAAYAAQAACALGVEAALVTVAPPDSPLLAALPAGLRVAVAPSEIMTTFVLDYSGPRRRLLMREAARPLQPGDVPPSWQAAPVVYAGSVAGECGRTLLDGFAGAHVIAAVQGWLRTTGPGGEVQPALLPEALDPPSALRVASLSEEDHPRAEELALAMAARGILTAITRGRRGATLLAGPRRLEVPAAPAVEVDPTGAGDVFALVLGLALADGAPVEQAARRAATAAARVVEGPGIGTLASSGA